MTAFAVGLVLIPANVFGQRLRATVQTERILRQLEMNTNRFSRSIDAALDRSRLDESKLEDQVNTITECSSSRSQT